MNKECSKLKELHFEGNVTPISWCDHIKKGQKQQTDLLAISILADIIYWYRPTLIRDEQTGRIIRYKQKFQADKLQKTYQYYSDLFGFPKSTIKTAVDNLTEMVLITREFRHFTTKGGLSVSNVMYLEPITENIKKITYRKEILSPKEQITHPQENRGDTPSKIKGTYTKTNKEITSYIKSVCEEKFFPILYKLFYRKFLKEKKGIYYINSIERDVDERDMLRLLEGGYSEFSISDFYKLTEKAILVTQAYKEFPYTDTELAAWFESIRILILDKKIKLSRINKILDWYAVEEHVKPRWTPDIHNGSDLVEKFSKVERAVIRYNKKHAKKAESVASVSPSGYIMPESGTQVQPGTG